jgi:hypothetical protein
MNPTHDEIPEPVVLIIADISGYTRYMTANAKTLAHSQTIITELVKTIVRHVELPLELAKLEGDAVFLFCRKQIATPSWLETKKLIGEKLLSFFRLFSDRVNELSRSTTCTCHACTHIEKLRLKVVVHSGEALFHRVFNFVELAGVDVILVHRLLKNSVTTDQYLLLTDAALEDLSFPAPIPWARAAETYDDIGHVGTLVYALDGGVGKPAATVGAKPQPAANISLPPFSTRFSESWRLYWKLWLSPLVPWAGSGRGAFQHITSSSSRAARAALALFTVVLTPVFVIVGTISVAVHALSLPANHRRLEPR